MKFKIRAVTFDLRTEPHRMTAPRDEVVNTDVNEIFADCETIRDVEIRYEDFWNYLNSENAVHNIAAKVKVLSVEPIPV